MTTSFLPLVARLAGIEPLIADHAVFTFLPAQPLAIAPGQFVEISLPGVGAFPVSACEIPEDGRLVSCIRRAGRVTDALFRLEKGAEVGLRGPFGRGFPVEAFHGRDALLVAGGLGMAPLRALLRTLLDLPGRSGRITLLYGAREPESLLFHDELVALAAAGRITLRLSVDFAEELPGPSAGVLCQIGLVTELLAGLEFAPQHTAAALCGPPALYRCVLDELAGAGIPPERIFATLERRMRCGVGECCHCVTGGVFICCEGPVFSLDRLRSMPGAI